MGLAILLGIAAAGYGVVRHHSTETANKETAPAAAERLRVAIANGLTVITLPAAQESRIATVTLRNAEYRGELRGYGAVLDLQPLTELNNQFENAKAQLDIAEAKLAASRTAFERARKLYADQQNISLAQMQVAQATFRVDQAAAAAARSQLQTLALTAQQNWGPQLGQALIEGEPLVRQLITRQKVLVQVTLPPGQHVSEAPAGASTEAADGRRVPLQFVSAATKTDPRIQGLSFFFTAASGAGLLPGMRVAAYLAGTPVDGAIVPLSAVVWQDGHPWVYVRFGSGFARRAIATDVRLGDGYLVGGLPNGSQVVTEGAQTLLSEEFRARSGAAATADED
ncbi:MAG: hypothetical protein ACM3JG_09770 [Thiohalocapsa sp.]